MHDATPLLHDYLRSSAARLPSKEALTCGPRRLSYGELWGDACALAQVLRRRGVGRGDRVAVFAPNSVEAATAFWAALAADAVAVMVNPLTKADRLSYVLRDCRAAALVTDGSLGEAVRAVAPCCPHLRAVIASGEAGTFTPFAQALSEGPRREPPRRNLDVDLAALVYTSGSTGDPKGVMLTHRNMLTAATSISQYLGLGEDDVVLAVLPLSFDYGLYQLILSARQGARVVLERSFTYPAAVLQAVVDERVTFFPGVPTMFATLMGMGELGRWDLSRVRAVTNTAAALHAPHIGAIRRAFPKARLFSMYGLTECKRVSYLPPEDLERKPGSVGLPIPNTEVWVVDEQGHPLPPNRIGQLVVRGATVMRGYWEKPKETAEKLRPGPLPGELVLYTGDLCRLDEDGYLYFVARTDDIIKSRGEKVAPKEVEAALVAVEGVTEAVVIGLPDPILGEMIKAFVVLKEGAPVSEQDLRRECQKRLPAFMVPQSFELVSTLPRTDSGKVKKTGLA